MTVAAQPRHEWPRAFRFPLPSLSAGNPALLAKSLVRGGRVCSPGRCLAHVSAGSYLETAPPDKNRRRSAIFGGEPFVVAGSLRWNGLRLEAPATIPVMRVCNTMRSVDAAFEVQPHQCWRTLFPKDPHRCALVFGLLQCRDVVGGLLARLQGGPTRALDQGPWDRGHLPEMAELYPVRATHDVVSRCLDVCSRSLSRGESDACATSPRPSLRLPYDTSE